MKNKHLKTLYNLSVIIFVLPAIIFWVLFAYAGSDLEGFFSLSGFIIDGYRDASGDAQAIFLRGLRIGSLGIISFLTLVTFLLNIGRGAQVDE